MLPDCWLRPLVVNADLSERRVVLKELDAQARYEAFLSVSTRGGSLNGTTIEFDTDAETVGTVTFPETTGGAGWGSAANSTSTLVSLHSDAITVVTIITASGVSLSLLIITMAMICFSKEKWSDRCPILCNAHLNISAFYLTFFFFVSCVSFPGSKDTSGLLFQILQTAA